MPVPPTITQNTAQKARDAVKFFWSMRDMLPDTDEANDTIREIRAVSTAAKAAGRAISDDEWLALAEIVDEACDEDGLPSLFGA